MGEARLRVGVGWHLLLAFGLYWADGLGGGHAAGPSRFASYGTEADCLVAHVIAPALCRTAFAQARTEYETKTPSFATEALCTRRYASCMAWPPGASRTTTFRPAWDGVDIVDTPMEQSVTPSSGSTGKAIRFAARPLTEPPRDLVIRAEHPSATASPMPTGHGTAAAERASSPSVAPPPGSGFKLEDGVLTYPAPERYQPKNLPKLN